MDKVKRDRDGEIFEDDLTENESEPSGSVREAEEEKLKLDPDVDSQDDDETMRDDRFGLDEKNAKGVEGR